MPQMLRTKIVWHAWMRQTLFTKWFVIHAYARHFVQIDSASMHAQNVSDETALGYIRVPDVEHKTLWYSCMQIFDPANAIASIHFHGGCAYRGHAAGLFDVHAPRQTPWCRRGGNQ